MGRQAFEELFTFYKQIQEWSCAKPAPSVLEYFSSIISGQVYDRAAVATSCLKTVFKYADLLCKINQHAFAKAADYTQEKQDIQTLHKLDEVCR